MAGRVGRPSKLTVDDYPDLVERVRGSGLLPTAAPVRQAPAKSDERHRLAAWIAAYRQAIVPYLSFLADVSSGDTEGSVAAATAVDPRSAAAWPARWLTRWRRHGMS